MIFLFYHSEARRILTSSFIPKEFFSFTISIIDASYSCFIASCDFFIVVFFITLRSYKLRKVLSSVLLKTVKS